MNEHSRVVGRYAPSPTGPLHFGNLRTALLAWLQARCQGGDFYLRIDDLDTPRVVEGSADQILHDLEWLGLDWDGDVVYQSQRLDRYQSALNYLDQQGLVYECFCSRKDIQQAASAPHNNTGVYPGLCRNLTHDEKEIKRNGKAPAIRVKVSSETIEFDDGCLAQQQENLVAECGDFVIKRADGLFAYQLAIVVDDLEQGITDVVRGADLLNSTARQLFLMRELQADSILPDYWHVPLMMDEQGQRLAKRDGAKSVSQWREEGRDQDQLIGWLAHSVGLIDQDLAISAQELVSDINLTSWQETLTRST